MSPASFTLRRVPVGSSAEAIAGTTRHAARRNRVAAFMFLSPLRSNVARIERVAQSVAEQVERKHEQEDRQARPNGHPRRVVDVVLGAVEHAAPAGRGRLLAEAE